MRVQFLEPLGGKRRSGAIAQQPLAPMPVVRCDADAGVEREPAAVVPPLHVPAIVFVDEPAPNEGAQDAAADLSLHRLGIGWLRLGIRMGWFC